MVKSIIWKLFSKHEHSVFVKCNLCLQDYKSSGNTSNLFDHAKRKHPVEFDKIMKGKRILSSDEENAHEKQVEPEKKIRRTVKDFFNRQNKYENNSERKQKLDRLLVNMICVDLEPFRIVEHSGFQKFVKELDNRYDLPSRGYLKDKLVPDLYNEFKNRLIKILAQVSNVALTTDLWTSPSNEGILTVTCHFFHEGNLRSSVLNTIKLEGHHTSENISKVRGKRISILMLLL